VGIGSLVDELAKQLLVIIGLFCGVRCVGHSLGVDIAEILQRNGHPIMAKEPAGCKR